MKSRLPLAELHSDGLYLNILLTAINTPYVRYQGFRGGSDGKESACGAGDPTGKIKIYWLIYITDTFI